MSDNPRRLQYSLRNSADTNFTTDSDSPESVVFNPFPIDPDEKIKITLNVSLNEYVDLASAIDVGRDIAFNSDSMKIWNLWTNAVKEAVVDCQEVADCIDTSLAVQQSITNEYQSTVEQFLDDNGSINPDKSDSTSTTETRLPDYSVSPVSPPPDNCNLDELWSGIREMVVRIDDKGRDLLEDLTLINDRAEQIQGLIDLVPLLGDIIADVAEFFTQAVPDLLNGYNAFSNETEIDNLACELFSMVCDECRYPTFEEVLGVYSSKSVAGLASSPQLLNYSQVWNAVRQVPSLDGSLVYHTINAWQLITYYFGSRFTNTRGTNILNIWISLGEELPTDNWVALCGGCVSWINVLVPATASPFTGANTVTIQIPANRTFTWKYVDGLWTYEDGVVSPFDANGTNISASGLVVPNKLGALIGRKSSNINQWLLSGNSGSFFTPVAIDFIWAFNDANGAFFDNSGQVNMCYKIE